MKCPICCEETVGNQVKMWGCEFAHARCVKAYSLGGADARALAAPTAPAPTEPVGCTPADAAMLRKANHALAAENDALRAQIPPVAIEYTPGEWFDATTVDLMEAFYLSRLPAIREAAKEHGYAIGVHGSMRRDLDLIAAPWRDGASDADTLVEAIQKAACGFTQSKYQWEKKPAGRIAISVPICWTHRHGVFSDGHIDLSVIATPPSAVEAAQPEAVGWKLVPIEPTQEMIDAAEAINPEDQWVQLPDGEDGTRRRTRDCDSVIYYRAMLAAAPTTEATSPSDAERLDAARWQKLIELVEVRQYNGYRQTVGYQFDTGVQSGETFTQHIDAAIATKGGKL